MREGRLELPPLAGLDPKSSASANSATRAMEQNDFTRIFRPAATDCKIRGELCPRSSLHKNPRVHIDPGDGWVPGGGGEGGAAIGNRHPPSTGLLHTAGDVGQAVAIEVADVDINPGDRGGPLVPGREIEGAAGAQSHPPPAG